MKNQVATSLRYQNGQLHVLDQRLLPKEEDVQLCSAMSAHGSKLVHSGARILTHCNTGSMATAGIGTVHGVITTAHQQGRNISVWLDETRPLLQCAILRRRSHNHDRSELP